MARRSGERGAAAVEFAVIAVALITLLTVLVDAAWLMFVAGTLAGAAREAARDFAIYNNQAQAQSVAVAAASGTGLAAGEVTFSIGSCTPGATVVVTISHTQGTLTKFVLGSVPLKATGAMRCGG